MAAGKKKKRRRKREETPQQQQQQQQQVAALISGRNRSCFTQHTNTGHNIFQYPIFLASYPLQLSLSFPVFFFLLHGVGFSSPDFYLIKITASCTQKIPPWNRTFWPPSSTVRSANNTSENCITKGWTSERSPFLSLSDSEKKPYEEDGLPRRQDRFQAQRRAGPEAVPRRQALRGRRRRLRQASREVLPVLPQGRQAALRRDARLWILEGVLNTQKKQCKKMLGCGREGGVCPFFVIEGFLNNVLGYRLKSGTSKYFF